MRAFLSFSVAWSPAARAGEPLVGRLQHDFAAPARRLAVEYAWRRRRLPCPRGAGGMPAGSVGRGPTTVTTRRFCAAQSGCAAFGDRPLAAVGDGAECAQAPRPLSISRRRTASARRSRQLEIVGDGAGIVGMAFDGHRDSGGLRLSQAACASSAVRPRGAELGAALAEEYAIADLALELGRRHPSGTPSCMRSCAGATGMQPSANMQHAGQRLQRRPTRFRHDHGALPRSRLPCERQDCAGIGAKLWLARLPVHRKGLDEPMQASSRYRDRTAEPIREAGSGLRAASWRLLSTVWARRFCDQQEMSLQTATGRSLP